MLSFEGETFMGAEAIVQKLAVWAAMNPQILCLSRFRSEVLILKRFYLLQNLSFQRVQHQVTTFDVQPVVAAQPNSILVFVSGQLLVDDSTNPIKFSQTFHLMPKEGGYWVHNDMFRLNYG
mmetsp:Transcript_998/g.2515  ORF Transcript_998/g.2515 Transcript_998/m.2515 type:complete len:121 (+) Transcript_998:82-444(+)